MINFISINNIPKKYPFKRVLRKSLPLLLVLITFFLLFKPTENHIFNIALRDEEDNFATGKWTLEGQKLYKDVFLLHQPSPTIMSAAVQKITKPNSIFLLVKRHREFVYFFSFFCIVLLTFRFGWALAIIGTILELTKFTLLGNIFIAEALVIYPLIYVVSVLLKAEKNDKFIKSFDLVVSFLFLIFILFTLLPLLPLTVLLLILLFRKTFKKTNFIYIFFLSIPILILIFFFSPVLNYFYWTFLFNLFSFIPYEAKNSFNLPIQTIFFLPVKTLFFQNTGFFLVIKTISLIYIITAFLLIKQKQFKIVIFCFLILALSNLRPLKFGIFNEGFHFLPWYSLLVTLTIFQTAQIKKRLNFMYLHLKLSLIFIFIIFLVVLPYSYNEFSAKADTYNMWYVNFSPYFDIGETIRQLANKNDKLLVVPQASLIYWQSGLLPSSPYFLTLNIMNEGEISKLIYEKWLSSPPQFLFFEGYSVQNHIYTDVDKYYVNIPQNGKNSNFFILKSKFEQIDGKKWSEVKRYGYFPVN